MANTITIAINVDFDSQGSYNSYVDFDGQYGHNNYVDFNNQGD